MIDDYNTMMAYNNHNDDAFAKYTLISPHFITSFIINMKVLVSLFRKAPLACGKLLVFDEAHKYTD